MPKTASLFENSTYLKGKGGGGVPPSPKKRKWLITDGDFQGSKSPSPKSIFEGVGMAQRVRGWVHATWGGARGGVGGPPVGFSFEVAGII